MRRTYDARVTTLASMPEAASPPSVRRAKPAETTKTNVGANAVVLAFSLATAFFIYGQAAGIVYSEYSDFALEFGQGPEAVSFFEVLSKYGEFAHGWYRPTSFYLAPYLLGIDYYVPATQVTSNIIFWGLLAAIAGSFASRAGIGPRVVGATVVLTAPALYLVSYGVQVDALYVLFGCAFIAAGLRAESADSGRWIWHAVALVCFFLAVTSKEVAVLAAPLLAVASLLRGGRLSVQAVRLSVGLAAPYLVAAAAFAAFYVSVKPADGGVYSTAFSLGELRGVEDLLLWMLGYRSPGSIYAHWQPSWGTTQYVASTLLFLLVVAAALYGRRALGLWRIGVFSAAVVGTAAAIALVGGLPHHAFPLVVMYGVAATFAVDAALRRWQQEHPGDLVRLGRVTTGLVVLVVVPLVLQARSTYSDALNNGPQSAFIKASNELFYGGLLSPLRTTPWAALVFEDCLGGLHNAARYFGRADVPSVAFPDVDTVEGSQAIRDLQAAGRRVFVARCTGSSEPWYELADGAVVGPRVPTS
jgi:hypothetical protein